MSNHPLFALPDEEFEEELARTEALPHVVERLRGYRLAERLYPTERQEALALWHSTITRQEGFRWPWKALDEKVGLLPTGDMAVVLAQTGSGKTTFTASLIHRVYRGTKTLVFATEIPDHRYVSALAARGAGLHPDRVQQQDWDHAGFRMTAAQARQAHAHAVSELLDWGTLTVAPHLRLRASQLKDTLLTEADRSDPKLVIVDHFQAIDHDLREGVSGVQATLALLQDFAVEQHITVIVTNQVHVRGQGGLPAPTDCVHLAGVFGGQSLGQAATQILGVHRVFSDLSPQGIAITPDYLREYRKAGGKDALLWDRSKVAIDLCKIRYDAYGNSGGEVKLGYKDGLYVDP